MSRCAKTDRAAPSFRWDGTVQRIRVPFAYPVCFARAAFDPTHPLLEAILRRAEPSGLHRVLVFVDAGAARANPGLAGRIERYFGLRRAHLILAARPRLLPGGERAKGNWERIRRLTAEIGRARICRHSFVIAVGGGAVLDAVGLAAALVHRGVRLVRMPTTAVGQNDVGVGVKNGIDAMGAKNFIGVFAPPYAVLNDLDFLRTLPDGEWRAGAAEAFKVAIIKDARFLRFLCANAARLWRRDEGVMEAVVRRCAALHMEHIRASGDPFEFGSARPLDFGHWSAHELEAMSGYGLGHGAAVAIGVALDTVYSWLDGRLSARERDAVLGAMTECGLSLWHPLLARRRRNGSLRVLDGMERFREHLGGELTVTLPSGLGRRVEVHRMNPARVERAAEFLRRRAREGGRA